MSTISHIQIYRPQPRQSTKLILALRRQRKCITDQVDSISPQKCENSNSRNILFPLMEKSTEFPSIFSEHKRNEYSGYKQINLNKSKTNKFQQEPREMIRYQTPRKYEINTRNIARLRKRYSLEPLQLKQSGKEDQRAFLSTSKSVHKSMYLKREDTSTERKYHKELREVIRLMNINQQSPSEKMFTNGEKVIPSLDGISQNLLQASKFSPEEKAESLTTTGQKVKGKQRVPNKVASFNKPYYVQLKKRVENKMQNALKKKGSDLKKSSCLLEQESDLCGWSTQSFYPKNRASFFSNSPFEKPRLIKGQI